MKFILFLTIYISSVWSQVSVVPVDFFLYTRANPNNGTQITEDTQSIDASEFNFDTPTYVIIHGWTQSYETVNLTNIRLAALRAFDCNVIMIDWPRGRDFDYISSVFAISRTGEKVAGMINFLTENYNMSLDSLTLVGHSLGSYVAGSTGRNIERGKAHKLMALDPAKPPVSYLQPEQGLSKNDARYVQIIHTSKVFPGFMKAIGNADFYPIGAQTQPGCENDLIGFCSHVRSIDYYAEALEFNDFASIKCDTYQQASTNSCGTTLSSVRMGARNPEDEVEGIYYVPLNKQYPFGVLYGENMDSD